MLLRFAARAARAARAPRAEVGSGLGCGQGSPKITFPIYTSILYFYRNVTKEVRLSSLLWTGVTGGNQNQERKGATGECNWLETLDTKPALYIQLVWYLYAEWMSKMSWEGNLYQRKATGMYTV